MSAYICTDNHISTIVWWAGRHNVVAYFGNPTKALAVAGNEQEVSDLLLAENTKSVNYRYKEHTPVVTVDLGDPRLSPIPSVVQVVKLVNCLDYQSCEHPEWDASPARALLEAVKSEAIRNLDGYSEAKWDV